MNASRKTWPLYTRVELVSRLGDRLTLMTFSEV